MANAPVTTAAQTRPLQNPAPSAKIFNLGEARRVKLMRALWAGFDGEGRPLS